VVLFLRGCRPFQDLPLWEIATMFSHEWADFPHDNRGSQAPILRI
jgi:hypothetical protein